MSEIKPNQNIKLFLDGIDVVLDCKVRYHENDRIILDYDKSILEYVDYLQEGDEVGVKIYTPVGVLVFDSIILYSPIEGDFIIEYVESSPKIQRREYARVNYDIKISLERNGKSLVLARTIDISGGGLKFRVEESENTSFKPDEKVMLTMYIPKESSIKATAIIIANPNLPKNVYVLQYSNIENNDRERIIKKTAELQRRDSAKTNTDVKVVIEKYGSKNQIMARSLDISGNGLKVETEEQVNFSKNEEVKITLYMPEGLPIVVQSKIVDIANLPDNVHVLQFISISETERKQLVKIAG